MLGNSARQTRADGLLVQRAKGITNDRDELQERGDSQLYRPASAFHRKGIRVHTLDLFIHNRRAH
jgi:hypothetical protein